MGIPVTESAVPWLFSYGHCQTGFQAHGDSAAWVRKFQALGTQQLACDAPLQGKGLGYLTAVLGISQNGKTLVGTVNPELMGPAGDGPQSQFT